MQQNPRAWENASICVEVQEGMGGAAEGFCRSRLAAHRIFVPLSSGEVVRLSVMGGNQSVPKITARDRTILE